MAPAWHDLIAVLVHEGDELGSLQLTEGDVARHHHPGEVLGEGQDGTVILAIAYTAQAVAQSGLPLDLALFF